jgi:hypothetical protein
MVRGVFAHRRGPRTTSDRAGRHNIGPGRKGQNGTMCLTLLHINNSTSAQTMNNATARYRLDAMSRLPFLTPPAYGLVRDCKKATRFCTSAGVKVLPNAGMLIAPWRMRTVNCAASRWLPMVERSGPRLPP